MKKNYTICGLLMLCPALYSSNKSTNTIMDINQQIYNAQINPTIPCNVQINFQRKLFGHPNVTVNMHHIAAVRLELPVGEKTPKFAGGHHQTTLRNLIAQSFATSIRETTHDNGCVDFVLTNNITGKQFLKTTFPKDFDAEKILKTITSSTLTSTRVLSDTITEFTAQAKDQDIAMKGIFKTNKNSTEVLTTYPILTKQFQPQNLANHSKTNR